MASFERNGAVNVASASALCVVKDGDLKAHHQHHQNM